MAKKVIVFAGHDDDTWEKTGGKGVKTDLEKDGVYEEYDTNIIIARGTVERLRKVKGLTVLFPQENGRNMTLAERVNYANSNDADLLVDIHSNASGNRHATGAAAFYWYSSKEGKALADHYASLLKQQNLPTWQGGTYASNLKDGWSGFYMLRYSNMPAILTENFFFTTRQELQNYLLNPIVQTKLMNIHAEMVTKFFGLASEVEQVSKPVTPKPVKQPAKPAAPAKTESIVDYLNARKQPSSFSARAKLAAAYNIPNYRGTAAQNTQLLELLRKDKPSAPASKPKKEYVQLPASASLWRTYRLNVQPKTENSDWSLTPARFGGLEYEVLGRPQANVVTIKTSKGKRNIYAAPSTGAKIVKK